MASNLPLPTYLALNQEQKNEIPEYSLKLYEISDNTPKKIEYKNSIVVVDDAAIADFPSIILPAEPEVGSTVNIMQGRTNQLIVSGNGKNILINYIKYSTNTVATSSEPRMLMDSGASYGANKQCSFTVAYTGEEWQNLGASILVNIQGFSDDETFTAARYYGMPQEAYTSPILITFTYSDSLGNLYSNKTITLTANKSSTVINPTSAVTNGSGVATFNVGCSQTGATIYTAHFDNLDGSPAFLNLTINYYEDASTISSSSAIVVVGDTADLTITIKDTNNDLYIDKNTSCTSNRISDVITTISNPTDGSGEAKFTISSPEVHVSTISAHNLTDNYTIADTTSITFIEVPPIPVLPTDQINLRYESDNGVYDFGTGELVLWTNQVDFTNLTYQNDTGRTRMIIESGVTTPSGVQAITIPADYYTVYTNIFSSSSGIIDRTICIIGRFHYSGYFKCCLGTFFADGVRFDGGSYGNGTDKYVTCSVWNPPESVSVYADYDWHVYLFTNASSTQTYVYKDNVLIGIKTTGIPDISNQNNSLVQEQTSTKKGYIAAFYAYDKVLTEEERTQLYDYAVYKFGV